MLVLNFLYRSVRTVRLIMVSILVNMKLMTKSLGIRIRKDFGSNPGSATYLKCDLEPVTFLNLNLHIIKRTLATFHDFH